MKKSTTGGSGRKGRRSVERPKEESNDPIGYGRPPREHRFRPGQSGNPRGRPKGAQSLASQVQQAYTAPVIVHEGCACRKSYPDVFVVQSAEMRLREDPTDRLNNARNRRVLIQR